jgi:hypothetical protein
MTMPRQVDVNPGPSGAVAVALLVYILALWPILYMVAAYQIGPPIPQTWLPLLLGALLVGLMASRSGERLELSIAAVGAVVLYSWVTLAILLGTDAHEANPDAYYNFLVSHLAFGGAMLLVGLNFEGVQWMLARPWAGRAAGLACCSLGLMVLLVTWKNPYGDVAPWYLLGIPKPATEVGANFNYLFISDYLAMGSLLLVSQAASLLSKTIIAGVTPFLLLWTSSRSALVCYLIVAGAVLFGHWLRARMRTRVASGIAALVVLALVSTRLQPTLSDVEPTHLLQRFDLTSIQEDESLLERAELERAGLARLKHNWVLGHFMDEVVAGREGKYMHNWLSFWQTYGLGPFLLFCALYVLLLLRVTVAYLGSSDQPALELLFALAWFVGLSIMLARSYGAHEVWLVLTGVPAGLRKKARDAVLSTSPGSLSHPG